MHFTCEVHLQFACDLYTHARCTLYMINVFDTALQVKRPSPTSLKAESMLSVEYFKYCRSITEHYNMIHCILSRFAHLKKIKNKKSIHAYIGLCKLPVLSSRPRPIVQFCPEELKNYLCIS